MIKPFPYPNILLKLSLDRFWETNGDVQKAHVVLSLPSQTKITSITVNKKSLFPPFFFSLQMQVMQVRSRDTLHFLFTNITANSRNEDTKPIFFNENSFDQDRL